MINSEEKFFSYLKGRMNSNEKKEFEDELLRSENLKEEFAEYKRLNRIIEVVKGIPLNKDYAASIITDFRKRIEPKESSKSYSKVRYAFASIIVIFVGYFLLSIYYKEKTTDLDANFTEFTLADLDSLGYYYDYSLNIDASLNNDFINAVDSIYSEKYFTSFSESIREKSLDDIVSFNGVTDVDEYLSEKDVDRIYAKLINKEIL